MKNLIILSGCSGVGKSSFWAFLQRTPPAIERVKQSIPFFDPGAAHFIDTTKTLRKTLRKTLGKTVRKDRLIMADPSAAFLVLHYDITHVYRIGTRDFNSDVALKFARQFDRIDVIHVGAPPRRLSAQFQKRAEERIAAGLKSDTIITKLRNRLRKLGAFLRGRQFLTEEEIYSDDRLIEEINIHWLNFIKNDMSSNHEATLLEVAALPNMEFTIAETMSK